MDCSNPKTIYPHRSVEWQDANDEYPVKVPCGKCIPCLMKKRSEWAFRLEEEHKSSHGAYFVTLTYDEKHLRTDGLLCKRDLQLYLKRLRKKDGKNRIRYYAVGEYGTRSGRPHYHLLLFNAQEMDIRSSWVDRRGRDIGLVHVGFVSGASVAYVLKYIVLPSGNPLSSQKPFAVMSRAYGIGGMYLTDEMVAFHRQSGEKVCMRFEQKVRMPRLYASKIWYDEKEREVLGKKAMLKSVQLKIIEEKSLMKKFGTRYKEKAAEMELAVIQRVKSKIQFSQKF